MSSRAVRPKVKSRPHSPALKPRETQKLETRAELIRAARRLFVRHGFENTTMRMLAADVGVALGTLFVHFEDKHALLGATLYDGVRVASADAIATLPQSASVHKQLVHLTEPLFQYYAQNPALSRVLLKENLFVSGDWGALFDEQLKTFQDAVGGVYSRARAQGQIRSDIDITLATTAFMAFYLLALVAGLRGAAVIVEHQVQILTALVEQQLQGFRTSALPRKASI